MAQTLQQRQKEYESICDQKIIRKVPVIIKIDGQAFKSLTKNTSKPFCHKIMALMNDTMLSLAKRVDGVVFAYQYSDKIILVLRNDRNPDTDPWFNNNIQKMATVAASIATYEFMTNLWGMNDAPDLQGPITFSAEAFPVPNTQEVVNYLIYRQFRCVKSAVSETAFSLLGSRHSKEETHALLESKSTEERKEIISEAGVNFSDLPVAYRHGTAAYFVPRVVDTAKGPTHNFKWTLDVDLSLFTDIKDKIKTIINTGSDIFRPERDLDGAV